MVCTKLGYKTIFLFVIIFLIFSRCGNVAAILELDDKLNKNYKIFDAAAQVWPIYFYNFNV